MGIFGAPRVPHDFVNRDRIDSLLETDAALIVVRTAAGGGKTVAAAAWAARADHVDGVWHTVQSGCASEAGFWGTTIELFHDAGLLSDDNPLVRSINSLSEVADLPDLLRRGFAQLPRETVLVLDDAQFIAEQSIRTDLISLLASTAKLRAIVLTRTMSRFEADDVRLALSPLIVSSTDLALTVDETRAMLDHAEVTAADDGYVEALHEAVGGNPLFTRGVVLALQRGEISGDVGSLNDALSGPGAHGLRQAIITSTAAPHEVDFAVKCSVPDVLTVELARELSERDDAAELISELERVGVGMWSSDTECAEFTISPLFRMALRSEVPSRFASDAPRLHRISAVHAMKRGDYFAALGHAFAADDLPLASDVVLAGWLKMPGPPSVITDRVGPLSMRTLHRAPLVTMLLALKYNAVGTHRARALEMFGIAAVSLRVRGNKEPATRRFVLSFLESVALRLTGRIDAAVSAADRSLQLFETLTLDDRDEIMHLLPTFYTQMGQSYLYGDRSELARELFRNALGFPRDISESGWYHGLSLTAGTAALQGDLDEAIRLTDIARAERWPEGWRDGYIGSMYQVAEAYRALEEFDLDRAQQHIDELAPHADTLEHWPSLLHVTAMIALARGRSAEGILALETEPSRHARSPVKSSRLYLDATHAILLLSAGRPADAVAIMVKHPKSSPLVALTRARIELATGKPESAVVLLTPLLNEVHDTSPRLRAEALLTLAAASERLQRTPYAIECLRAAAVLMHDRRMRLPLMLIPRSDLLALSELAREVNDEIALLVLSGAEFVPDVLPGVVAPVALSAREQVVLDQLIVTGSASEIAEKLFVSPNTVKSHLRSLYRKLGANSREEALMVASERGLLKGQA